MRANFSQIGIARPYLDIYTLLGTTHQTHTGIRFASVLQYRQLSFNALCSKWIDECDGSKSSDDLTYSNLVSGPLRLPISRSQNISKKISDVGLGIHDFRLYRSNIGLIALSTFLELRPTTLRIVVDFIVSS